MIKISCLEKLNLEKFNKNWIDSNNVKGGATAHEASMEYYWSQVQTEPAQECIHVQDSRQWDIC